MDGSTLGPQAERKARGPQTGAANPSAAFADLFHPGEEAGGVLRAQLPAYIRRIAIAGEENRFDLRLRFLGKFLERGQGADPPG